MADALLTAGATVALASRESARLHAAVRALRSRGLDAHALPMDVREPQAVDAAAVHALRELGGVDLVVNNAGIGMRTVNPRFLTEPRPFFEIDPDRFRDVVATNLTGYFLVARAFARHFVERGRGRFVNVSVNRETMRRRGFVPYGPSRAGSEALSVIMAEDLRPFGICVNILVPGGVTATGMIPEDVPAATRERMLRPEVMGPPIVFLASAEAEGLTGQRIEARDFDRWLEEHRSRPG